ncbi:aminopeptidase P family N-terminal domain-containing protein [Neobacillus sp. YIM B02564]|uniref:Aminopeptidase P family N-terminal domain-containing protein n=1 Tax=Neobacillus paridis TaxID=2803862 RepID=A0ABS1TR38_9BACI|nr:aminopeptidase P family N-terminal domain-containing protein [Neobacillus paridis]MBL4953727.1 aminopeptidase P family N-terminal domain-containing protein [Neobacillus paridis]
MNYSNRRQKLVNSLKIFGIETILIQNLESIYYLTGFHAANASRPFGLVLSGQETVLIVPATAANSAKVEAKGIGIKVYYEHPVSSGESLNFHTSLTKVIGTMAQGKLLGVEAGSITLADMNVLTGNGFEVQDISAQIAELRAIKEPEELDAIRVSAKYAEYMALIIQPALYIPGIGGFRCSDTVIVQDSGCELVTHYPRDIQSLTLSNKQIFS